MTEPDVHAPVMPTPSRSKAGGRWLRATIVLIMLIVLILVVALIIRSGDDSAGTASSATAASPENLVPVGTSQVAAPATNGQLPITVSGNSILRGGEPWWFLGYNSYTWSADCGFVNELMSVEQVDEWFGSMRHDGHGAVRLMFFEGWDLSRLDAAIASAERNNIYVTITLDNGNQDCSEEKKSEQWFDDANARYSYGQHMLALMERYKGNNTVAWFEYFNEPRYYSGKLREFFDEMGALADTVDRTRLFASGTIASYSLSGEANFLSVHQSPGVDIASLHEYDYGKAESHHGPLVIANSAGKPVIVGEFGVIDNGSDERSCLADIEKRVERVEQKVVAYLGTPGYVGAFAWVWQPGRVEGTCGAPGIAADQAVQAVLRNAGRP